MSAAGGTRLQTLSGSFSWRAEELEWPLTTDVGPGLDGVVATSTRVTWLDPTSGTLCYRDVSIEELASRPDFEAVAYLLMSGRRAEADQQGYTEFTAAIRGSRHLPPAVEQLVRDLPPTTHPTRLLRAGVSVLGCHQMSAGDDLTGKRHWHELRIVGQVAALLAVVCSHRSGADTPVAEPASSLASSVLEALTGRAPEAADEAALNLLWVLYAAHGMDAPTFTSMVVASCLADPYTNVVAGLSAMRGSRQGGTGEQVLGQLLGLEDPDHARRWVADAVDSGDRIAGFGHRHYRMPDPRVVLLRKEVAAVARRQGREQLFTIARAVEEEATRRLAARGIHVNINFYAALLFHLLGADAPLVPCLLAVGRLAGLVALVREALDQIRLFRPLSRYTGEVPPSAESGPGR